MTTGTIPAPQAATTPAPEATAAAPAPNPPAASTPPATPAAPQTTTPPAAPTPPASTESALALPEGTLLPQTHLAAVQELAGKLGKPEAAAELLARDHALVESVREASMQAFEGQKAQWRAEVEAHPQLGGVNWPKTKANLDRVMADPAIGTPELRQLLEETGAGNHPAVVAVMSALGARMAEGTITTGQPAPQASKPLSDGEVFYGKPSA